MKKIKVWRHGEILFVPVKQLPQGLKKTDTNVIMRGSGDNPHTVRNADIYFKEEDTFVFGYIVTRKGNKLIHPTHGDKKVNGKMECSLPVGIYQLRRQIEDTNKGMKPVVD